MVAKETKIREYYSSPAAQPKLIMADRFVSNYAGIIFGVKGNPADFKTDTLI